ncbi:MAG: DUF2892 domain-containing protein [Ignisphaera sp.]
MSQSTSDRDDREEHKRRVLHSVMGGIFLIGLAILFYFHSLWPWILALIGALMIVEALTRYKSRTNR